MGDSKVVECEALAVGRACFAAGTDASSDALVSAARVLPPHLLRTVMCSLLRARELPQLLDTLHAALHLALLGTAVLHSNIQGLNERDASPEPVGARASAGAEGANASGATVGRLSLCSGTFSLGACASVVGLIPLLPPLSAAVCWVALPAVNLVDALCVHKLTRLDLSGTDVMGTCVSAHALADTLSSWPGLRALCLQGHTGGVGGTRLLSLQAASDILAPALAESTALASLNLKFLPITDALAHAVGALTELAVLGLDYCTKVQAMGPHFAMLPHLRTLRAHGVNLSHVPADVGRPATGMLAGLAACAAIVHLSLRISRQEVSGLELAAMPHLEMLEAGHLSDTSISGFLGALPPFAVDEHACRFGLRALPHLQLLTLLSMDEVDEDSGISALTVALPLLPRLASFEMGRTFGGAEERALAAGWAAATSLRNLACFLSYELPREHDAEAVVILPQGLTSLTLSVGDHDDGDEEVVQIGEPVDGLDVAPLQWLSGHIAQLTDLSELTISANLNGAQYFAAQPTLAVLSGITGLRQLSLESADVRDVEWGATPLRALTSLTLLRCAACDAMPRLAQLTCLRSLALQWCQLQPDLVSAFVRLRKQWLAVAGTPPPRLDLCLYDDVKLTAAVLSTVLEFADEAGLQHVSMQIPVDGDVREMVEAFNLRWGRYKSCTHVQLLCM